MDDVKKTASEILGFSEERSRFLIGILEECFSAGIIEKKLGDFSLDLSKCILHLESKLDLTRREQLWISAKLGEAAVDRSTAYLLYISSKLKGASNA